MAWVRTCIFTCLKRANTDVTGVLGTGLGVLNSIDAEVLANKLAIVTIDLNRLNHPLRPHYQG